MFPFFLPFGIGYTYMTSVYLYDHTAVPPTWEIIGELPNPSDDLANGAAMVMHSKILWRDIS